jgi:hypothetical protein
VGGGRGASTSAAEAEAARSETSATAALGMPTIPSFMARLLSVVGWVEIEPQPATGSR